MDKIIVDPKKIPGGKISYKASYDKNGELTFLWVSPDLPQSQQVMLSKVLRKTRNFSSIHASNTIEPVQAQTPQKRQSNAC